MKAQEIPHTWSHSMRKGCIMLVLLCLMQVLALPVAALTLTGSIANITASANNSKGDSYGSVSLSGNTITMMAKGYREWFSNKSSTTTVTITAGADMTLSYTAAVTSGSGSVGSTSGSNIALSSGGTYSFTVTSAASNNAETWATVTLSIQLSGNVATTFGATSNGTYTVTYGETTVYSNTATGGTDSRTSDTAYTLTASPATGYEFGYWVNASGVKISDSSTYSFYPDGSTIKPVFYPIGSGRYYVLGTANVFYGYLDEAITAAGAGGTVVVCGSGDACHSTGSTSISIPAGTTLLIPYSDSDTSIKSGTSEKNDFKHANVNFPENSEKTIVISNESAMDPELNVLYTLTIPQGVTVTVQDGTASNMGRIVVGGTIVGCEGTLSTIAEGVTYGPHSNLVVNGTLNLGSYSVLSAAGYVLGNGNIYTTGTGAELYQPMVIHDWRGAKFSIPFIRYEKDDNRIATIQSGEDQVCPFTTWGTFNIQPTTKITYGNYMYLYASLYDSDAYCTHALLVGPGSGLIQLASGAYMTSTYQDIAWGSGYTYGFPGRMNISIFGGATLGSLQLDVSITVLVVTADISMNTANYTLPVSYNYGITLNSGNYYVDTSMAMLPGTSITVNEGANLYVGNNAYTRFMVFDGLNNRFYHNNGTISYVENTRLRIKNYPTTGELQAARVNGNAVSGDAELIVNGKLVIGQYADFGGLIQTNGNGVVDATAGTAGEVPSAAVQIGIVGTKSISVHSVITGDGVYSGMSLHESPARIISAATGESFNVVRGTLYNGSAYSTEQASYSFKFYSDTATVTNVILVGDAVVADGETATATKDAHPLNETIYGGWACETHSYDEESATTTATCTEAGIKSSTCTVCGHTKEEAQAALGHTPGDAATCTTAQTCTVCGETLQAALGHSFSNELVDGMYIRTCSVCNTEVTEYPVELKSMSLWTDGEVGLWLKVAISDILLAQDGACIVVTEEGNEIEDEQVTKYTMAQLTAAGPDSNGRYVLKQSIASGEMTGDVTITAFLADETPLCIGDYKEGIDFLDDTDPYSVTRTVIDYVRLVLAADSSDYANLQAMVTAMVTYGGYAQTYFGVDTENLAYNVLDNLPDISDVSIDQVLTITSNTAAATASLSEPDDTTETEPTETEAAADETTPDEATEAVETEPEETEAAAEETEAAETQEETASTESTGGDATAYTSDVGISPMSVASADETESSAFGLEYASQTVTLDSKISLKTYFTIAEGASASIADYTFTYTRTDSDETGSLTPMQSGDRYYVLIENIPVAYWDAMYDITVTSSAGDTYVVTSSVLAWVKRCLESTSAGEALNNLARAMYLYNQAANDNFGK